MGYSRSCPRTQAAPPRHVSDLTPRSDSRPHQPFSLPKHRANTESSGSGSARAHHKVKLVPHRAFLLSGSPLLVPAVSLLPRAAAIRDGTPLNHFSVPSPSLVCLPQQPKRHWPPAVHRVSPAAALSYTANLLPRAAAADEKTMASSQSFRRLSAAAALSCTASLLPSAAAIRDSNPRRLS